MIPPILLSKLANDAGFDLEHGDADGWLAFGIGGRPLRVWLRSQVDGLAVALSRQDVLVDLTDGFACHGALPHGAAGARTVATPDELVALLVRARVLDRTLPQALLHEYTAAVATIDSTEAYALVRQRRGQELFRQGLMAYWQGCCAITGLAVPELLRASHAKPWKDATDAERLDVHNGLLLAAHLDAAFDQGLITVGTDGGVIVSPTLNAHDRAVLGLDVPRSVRNLRPAHEPYLAWHRTSVYRPRSA